MLWMVGPGVGVGAEVQRGETHRVHGGGVAIAIVTMFIVLPGSSDARRDCITLGQQMPSMQ